MCWAGGPEPCVSIYLVVPVYTQHSVMTRLYVCVCACVYVSIYVCILISLCVWRHDNKLTGQTPFLDSRSWDQKTLSGPIFGPDYD